MFNMSTCIFKKCIYYSTQTTLDYPYRLITCIFETIIIEVTWLVLLCLYPSRKRFGISQENLTEDDIPEKTPPIEIPSCPKPTPKPRTILAQNRSLTLPTRIKSIHSSEYYACIDLCGDADYENIARKKIDARTGKEIFRPLYGSRFVHASARESARVTRTLQERVCHQRPRNGELYEDTTVMVDNDLYASRDEISTQERPEPPARINVGSGGMTKAWSHSAIASYLPEESAQG